MRPQQPFNLEQSQRLLALVMAGREPDIAAIRSALDAGADPNFVGIYGGHTPLDFAAVGGHTAIALALIEGGAAVDRADNHGYTPLHQAAVGGHTAIALALIEGGAAVDRADNDGGTALHQAVIGGHTATALALIERGAAVDRADNDGGTTLYRCRFYPQIVSLLLIKGADPFLDLGAVYDSLIEITEEEESQEFKLQLLTALTTTGVTEIRTAADGNPIIQIKKRTATGDIVDAEPDDIILNGDNLGTPQIPIPQDLRPAAQLISQIATDARAVLSQPAQPAREEPRALSQAEERIITLMPNPPEGLDPADPNAISNLNTIRNTTARLIGGRGRGDLLLEALKRAHHPKVLLPIASGLLEVCSIKRLDKAVFHSKRLSHAVDSFLAKPVAEEMTEDAMKKKAEDLLEESKSAIIPTLPELGMITSIAYNREAASIFLENLRDCSGARELPATIEEAQEGAKEFLCRLPRTRQTADVETTRAARDMDRYLAILNAATGDLDKISVAQELAREVEGVAKEAELLSRRVRRLVIGREGIAQKAEELAREMEEAAKKAEEAAKKKAEELPEKLELVPKVLAAANDHDAYQAANGKFDQRQVLLLRSAAQQYDERMGAAMYGGLAEAAPTISDIKGAEEKAIAGVNFRRETLGQAVDWDQVLANMADPQEDVLRAAAAARPQGAAAMEVGERPQVGATEPMEVDADPIGAPAPNVAQPKARAPRGPAIKRPRED